MKADDALKKYDPYPFAVVHDRYGGTYSRGKFTCWWGIEVVDAAQADDCSASAFWAGWESGSEKRGPRQFIGVGDTVEAAIMDAVRQFEESEHPLVLTRQSAGEAVREMREGRR